MDQHVRGPDQLVDEPFRQEARRLRQPELNRGSAPALDRSAVPLVAALGEAFVERAPPLGNHQIRNCPRRMRGASSAQISNSVPTTSIWVDEYQSAPVCAP